MPTYIALLRGINVSGQKKIQMVHLSRLLESLGLNCVQTYIQSGNVVFDTTQSLSERDIETQIQQAIQQEFGFDVPTLVISSDEWADIVHQNPFTTQRSVDPQYVHVTIFDQVPDPHKVLVIESVSYAPDEYIIVGRCVYLYCPNGYGNTRLSNAFFESKLKLKATTRNWKTTTHLLVMAKNNRT
jgi:uncharacterized protein (DUF1697 family)